MSSVYQVLCLTHDPAILTEARWEGGTGGEAMVLALHAASNPETSEALAAHIGCDLVVGRYSYPLVEVLCPPCRRGESGTWDGCVGYHPNGPHRVDAPWLRIMLLHWQAHPEADLRTPGCWGPERVKRLRLELDAA